MSPPVLVAGEDSPVQQDFRRSPFGGRRRGCRRSPFDVRCSAFCLRRLPHVTRGLPVCCLPPPSQFAAPGVDLFSSSASRGSFRRVPVPASPRANVDNPPRPSPCPRACVPRLPASAPTLTYLAANSRAPTLLHPCLLVLRGSRPPQPHLGTHIRTPTSPSPKGASRLQQL